MAAPTTTSLALPWLATRADNPFMLVPAMIGSAYKEALDASARDLLLSSTRIVQEHSLRAMAAASQACAQALLQNAVRIQQQTFERLLAANTKALQIMSQSYIGMLTSR